MPIAARSEEHTSELQSQFHLVCRLLLEKKKIDVPIALTVGTSGGVGAKRNSVGVVLGAAQEPAGARCGRQMVTLVIPSPVFFFNDPAPTEIYTLSLHDALPISTWARQAARPDRLAGDRGAGRRLLLVRVEMELRVRRASGLGAETLSQGLDLQDLGRRDGDGVDARLVDRKVPLYSVGQEHGEADQPADGPSREPPLRAARRPSHDLFWRDPLLRHEGDPRGRNPV